MTAFSREVEEELRAAGWEPERSVNAAEWLSTYELRGIVVHEAAKKFLAEFGGLKFLLSGPGVSSAREPFELDPMLCLGEEDRFSEWGADIGHSLFPIGELAEGRYFLGIDEEEAIYLVETWIASFGKMPEAMENLILGLQPVTIDDGYES